eukprot:COSAG01_NODE_10065_length_2258_cov_2.805465_4_plen_113_part_00
MHTSLLLFMPRVNDQCFLPNGLPLFLCATESVCDWLATFSHLAGVDPEVRKGSAHRNARHAQLTKTPRARPLTTQDPNTVGYRYDGTPFPLPGIDSLNMWGLIAGVQQESPR